MTLEEQDIVRLEHLSLSVPHTVLPLSTVLARPIRIELFSEAVPPALEKLPFVVEDALTVVEHTEAMEQVLIEPSLESHGLVLVVKNAMSTSHPVFVIPFVFDDVRSAEILFARSAHHAVLERAFEYEFAGFRV